MSMIFHCSIIIWYLPQFFRFFVHSKTFWLAYLQNRYLFCTFLYAQPWELLQFFNTKNVKSINNKNECYSIKFKILLICLHLLFTIIWVKMTSLLLQCSIFTLSIHFKYSQYFANIHFPFLIYDKIVCFWDKNC